MEFSNHVDIERAHLNVQFPPGKDKSEIKYIYSIFISMLQLVLTMKVFQQSRQHALRDYCRNVYTVE